MNDLLHLLQPESIVNNTNNNDTYCLRWTRHPHMLADALEINKNEISKVSRKQTTENGPFSDPLMDLTVHLDDGSHIKLHSVVLAAGSDYFQTLGQVGSHSSFLVSVHTPIFTYYKSPVPVFTLSVLAEAPCNNTPTTIHCTSNTTLQYTSSTKAAMLT